jgi:uncharacterized protein (DUF2062 family)
VTSGTWHRADSTTQKRRRSLKRRRLLLLLELMGRVERPERVAAAVALGVGIGLSPFIGFHFILAIVLAFLFRLNKLDAVLGSFVGNPWTLPPFFALGFRVGRWVLGYSPESLPPLRWQRILHSDFWTAFHGPAFLPRLASFLVGTTILAAAVGFGTYLVARGVLRLYHRRHPRVAERAARRRERSETAETAPPPEIHEPGIGPGDRVH